MRSSHTLFLAFAMTTFAAFSSEDPGENPTTIDFENQSRGEQVEDQFEAEGLRISASNWSDGPDAAVVFDTENIGLSDDNDLEAPLDSAPGFEAEGDLAPGKVMILHEREDCANGLCAEPDDEGSRPAGWLELEFAVPVTLHGFRIIDVNYEAGETPAQLVLFDSGGEILDSLDIPGVEGQGNWRPWVVERSDVQRARLYLPGDGAIDDISFTPQQAVNWAPKFESQSPVAVSSNGIYRYSPEVADPDGDTVSLGLDSAPAGMVLSPAGEISWSPSGVTGSFPVVVTATDAAGASAEQAFLLVVEDAFLRIQDFEFPAGTILDSELLPDGLEVRARNLSKGPDVAVVFDTNHVTGEDSDLGAPFQEGSENDLGLGEMNPGKVLVLHERHDCDATGFTCAEPDDESSHPAGWIEFRFSQPAHVWSLDVFDVTSDDPAARAVELFDANDQPLGSGLTLTRTGSNDWDRLVIDTTGVSRMRMNLDGDAAFDNLRYALVGSAEPENRPPVINDEEFEILKNETLSIPAPGVLANDSDPDGDPIIAVLDEEPAFGSVALNQDGSFVYTPDVDFVGKDEFEYRVRDAESASVPEDVEVYVTGEPEPDPDPEPDPEPVPTPTIESFTLDPFRVVEGTSSILSWSVTNAAQVTINGNAVASAGSQVVTPLTTTTYVLNAVSPEGGTVSLSRTLVVKDFVPLTFLYPQEGEWVSGPRPSFTIHFESDNGIYPPDLHFEYMGERLFVTCTLLSGHRLSCRPDEPVAEGAMTLTAYLEDDIEIYSNIAVLNFNVDSTPPYAPDMSKITVSKPDAENRVDLTGLPGAVEPLSVAKIRTKVHQGFNNIPTNPDGSFEYTFTSSGGATFTLASSDAVGNMSAYTDFQVPYPDPAMTITSPQAGTFVNNNQPEIQLDYQQVGAGLDFNTLALTDNDNQLQANCTHQSAESRCVPSTPLAEGTHSITATISDTAGNTSNVASTNFTVDTIPPDPVDRSKVSLVQEPEGTVTITGEAGAAEAGGTIVVLISGNEYSTVAGTAGEFTMEVSAGTGDQLSIYQSDVAGNAGAAEVFEVQATPVAVTISSPVAGSSVSGLITVRGHHNGPTNTGVVINGMPAIVDEQGNFLISNLPMSEGAHDIAVIAKAPGRSPGNATISVTSDGSRPQLKLAPAAIEGLSPVPAAFHVEYGGISEILQVEVDIDGNGSMDAIFNGQLPEFTYTYTTPGIFAPKVRLHTVDGIHEATASVLVMDAAALEARIRQQWSDFSAALAAGDTETALSGMTRQAANRYRILFETLGTQLAAGVSEYSQPELGHLDAGGGELLVSRPYEGETLWYVISFVRDVDGVWRIESL